MTLRLKKRSEAFNSLYSEVHTSDLHIMIYEQRPLNSDVKASMVLLQPLRRNGSMSPHEAELSIRCFPRIPDYHSQATIRNHDVEFTKLPVNRQSACFIPI
jgi:hypothetical protein